jgi:hypothetical protein
MDDAALKAASDAARRLTQMTCGQCRHFRIKKDCYGFGFCGAAPRYTSTNSGAWACDDFRIAEARDG